MHGLDVVADRDLRGAAHDHPVLGAMVVHLQRQPPARFHHDALDLIAGAVVERLVLAPGPMHLQVVLGDLGRDLLQPLHELPHAVDALRGWRPGRRPRSRSPPGSRPRTGSPAPCRRRRRSSSSRRTPPCPVRRCRRHPCRRGPRPPARSRRPTSRSDTGTHGGARRLLHHRVVDRFRRGAREMHRRSSMMKPRSEPAPSTAAVTAAALAASKPRYSSRNRRARNIRLPEFQR